MINDADDLTTNPTTNRPFGDVVKRRFSRRTVLSGGAAGAATFVLAGVPTAAGAADAPVSGGTAPTPTLAFKPIATSSADAVTVPTGYSA